MTSLDQGARSPIAAAGVGACLATGAWLALGELGVLGIVGLGTLGQLPLATGAGVLLGVVRLERLLWWLLGPATAVLALVGTSDLVRAPVNQLVRRDPLPAHADAVVVLAGVITRDARIGEGALSRLVAGVTILRAGVSSDLVLTRLIERHGGQVLRSDGDQAALARQLAPGTRLHLVGPVGNTRAEAVAVADLARRERWHRLIVVTAPIHSRRACATFEGAGVVVVCRPAAERKFAVESLPSPGDRIPAFREWLYERVAWTVYHWRGWVR